MIETITTTMLAPPPPITDRELAGFRELIYGECGISLSDAKRSMVSVRLSKRLRALGLHSYGEYYDYVCSPDGRKQELGLMINVITTNTTEFFRERKHFDFLVSHALPALIRSQRFRRSRHLNVWSAGCSSGEEPYTLAMVLSDFFIGEEGSFTIYATDISTKVLSEAKRAVYDEEAVRPVPVPMKRSYLMQGSGAQAGRYRVVPELRERIIFNQLNFMDDRFNVPSPMDIIFCRNVIIYFDSLTKANLIGRFYNYLAPGGYYFTGHSETLSGLNSQFVLVAPTIYTKTANLLSH